MRTSETGRDAKSLGRTDNDIRPQRSRRRDQRERQQVGGDDGEGTGFVRAGDKTFQVADRSVGGRVLKEGAENRFFGTGLRRPAENPDAQRFRPRANQGNRLGMAMVGHKKRIATLDVMAQAHGFRRGGRLVEQGRVGYFHPGEVAHHRLEIQQRFQAALRDLGLIRRVGGIPARIFQNISADDGRRECPVITRTDIGLCDHVSVHQGSQIGERLFLRTRGRQRKLAVKPDVRGNGFADEVVNGSASDHAEHRIDFRARRADMAGGKCAHAPICAR